MDGDLRNAERELGSAPELPATWQKYACDLERAGANEATLFSKIVGHCGRFVKDTVLSEAAKITQWGQGDVIIIDPAYAEHLADYEGHATRHLLALDVQRDGQYTFLLIPEKGAYNRSEHRVDYRLVEGKLIRDHHVWGMSLIASQAEFTPQDYISRRAQIFGLIDKQYGSGANKTFLQRLFGSGAEQVQPDANRRNTLDSILSAAGTVVQEKLLPRLEAFAEQSERLSVLDFEPALSSLVGYSGHLDQKRGVEITNGLCYVEKELVTMPVGGTEFYRGEDRKISRGHYHDGVFKYHAREVQPTRSYIEHLPRLLELLAPTETVPGVQVVEFATGQQDELYDDD